MHKRGRSYKDADRPQTCLSARVRFVKLGLFFPFDQVSIMSYLFVNTTVMFISAVFEIGFVLHILKVLVAQFC